MDSTEIKRNSFLRNLVIVFLFFDVYLLTAIISMQFVVKPENMAAVWLPSGIAVGALLINEKRKWWGFIPAIFIANLTANLMGNNSITVSAGYALGNTLEPLLCALIFISFVPGYISLRSFSEVVSLMASTLLGTMLAGAAGALVPSTAFGAGYWDVWLTWWIPDTLGIMLFAPLLVFIFNGPRGIKIKFNFKFAEQVFLMLLLIALSYYVFVLEPAENQIIRPILLLPVILWVALRFSNQVNSVSIVVLASIVIAGISNKTGAFTLPSLSLRMQLISAQLFLSVVIASSLILNVIVEEIRMNDRITKIRLKIAEMASSNSGELIITAALDEIAALTRSKGGIYYFVSPDHKMITRQIWSKGAIDKFNILQEERDNFPVEGETLWQGCFNDKKPVMINNYSTLNHIKNFRGNPETVNGVLFVPVIRNKQVAAVIELFEKEGNYVNVEAKLVSQLGDLSWDIFEKYLALEKSKETEKQYQALVESSQDLIWKCDCEGRFVFLNRAWEEIAGYKIEEMLGRPFTYFQLPHNAEKDLQEFILLLAGKEIRNYEMHFVSRRGENIDVIINAKNNVDENGKLLGVSGTGHNITEFNKAQLALRRREEQTRNILVTAMDGYWSVNEKGIIVDVNDAASFISGFSKDELVGKYIYELEASEMPGEVFEHIKVVFQKGQDRFESKHRKKDGSVIDVEMSVTWNPESKMFFSFVRDITEQKRSQEQVQMLAHSIRSVGECVSVTDLENNIIFANESFCATYGYKNEELIGSNMSIVSSGKNNNDIAEIIIKATLNGGWHGELINKRKNGEEFPIELSTSEIYDESRNVIALIGVAKDITERKKAEQLLVNSEERFRTMADFNYDWEYWIGPDRKYVYISPSCERITGYPAPRFAADTNFLSKIMHPEDSANYAEHLNETLKDEAPTNIDFRIFNSSGKIRWINHVCQPVFDSEGKYLGRRASNRDITDRKLIEIELERHKGHLEELVVERTKEVENINFRLIEQLNKQKSYEMMLEESLSKEKELSEMKSRFITTTSHEFRTPLTAILSSVELIERYGENWQKDKIDEHSGRIKNSVFYLTKLLENILTIGRTENGSIQFKPVKINLRRFCNELLKDLESYSKQSHSMEFSYNSAKNEFYLDKDLLRFILVNLLTNAYKYSPAGGKVSFSVIEKNKKLEFVIRDEGIGIPADERNHLFEPFYRASNSKDVQGTGLGLSIVKRSVELHNGEIYYDSILNKGTAFYVIIPVDGKFEK